MANGWDKGFIIEHDPGVRKRINCSDCINYIGYDQSCNVIKKPISEVGYNYWSQCKHFELDHNAVNYSLKVEQIKRRNEKSNHSKDDAWRFDRKSDSDLSHNYIRHTYIGEYIILLDVNEIDIPCSKEEVPGPDNILEMERHYKQNGKVDKPIIVQRVNERYVLKHGYDRYYFAKSNNECSIPAMIDGERTSHRYWLCKVGRRISHRVYGEGVVVDFSLDKIIIEFGSTRRTFMLDDCVSKDLLY